VKQPSHPWISLRAFLKDVESSTELNRVDDMSARIFDWIYARSATTDAPIFVQTVVMESGVASPATIHKSLATLERVDFVSIQVDPSDARRRIVAPTDRGHRLVKELSRAVSQWVQSTSLAKSASRERSPR
jgi:DNA-binding MarR family transcriptional regulator